VKPGRSWVRILIGSTKITVPSFQILTKRVLIGVAAALAIFYCVDYLSVRVRLIHPKPADPFESLTSTRILAIPEKDGKTELEVDVQNPQQTVICVHSLFPHFGHSPCWFAKPRINQPIPMTIFRVPFFNL
jgi:hypothetical protein